MVWSLARESCASAFYHIGLGGTDISLPLACGYLARRAAEHVDEAEAERALLSSGSSSSSSSSSSAASSSIPVAA